MKILSFLCMFLVSGLLYAHGENRPGPHGGHIRMPGAFHTELVLNQDSISIFLLDMGFKNPVIENSEVNVFGSTKKGVLKGNCHTHGSSFMCMFSEKISSLKSITIKAKRNGLQGKEAVYSLPLSFPKSSQPVAQDDHSHHH